jgi:hypothetical protein
MSARDSSFSARDRGPAALALNLDVGVFVPSVSPRIVPVVLLARFFVERALNVL